MEGKYYSRVLEIKRTKEPTEFIQRTAWLYELLETHKKGEKPVRYKTILSLPASGDVLCEREDGELYWFRDFYNNRIDTIKVEKATEQKIKEIFGDCYIQTDEHFFYSGDLCLDQFRYDRRYYVKEDQIKTNNVYLKKYLLGLDV